MDKYRIVCEEANVQLKAAQYMEKEAPARFHSMLTSGYCNDIGINLRTLQEFRNAGVTESEIIDALFKYREQKENAVYPYFNESKEALRDIKAIRERVNVDLEDYGVDGITPEIIMTGDNYSFKMNLKESLDGNSLIPKVYKFYTSTGSFLNKPTLKTVEQLKKEVLDELEKYGYKIKKVSPEYEKITIAIDAVRHNGEDDSYEVLYTHKDFSLLLKDNGDIYEYIIEGHKIKVLQDEPLTVETLVEYCNSLMEVSLFTEEEKANIAFLIGQLVSLTITNINDDDKECLQYRLSLILDDIAKIIEIIIESEDTVFYKALMKIMNQGFRYHASSYFINKKIVTEIQTVFRCQNKLIDRKDKIFSIVLSAKEKIFRECDM